MTTHTLKRIIRKGAAAVVAAGLLLGAGAQAAQAGTDTPKWAPKGMQACATEDSSNCYWDSAHRGNKRGLTFWVGADEQVHYTYVRCVKAANRMAKDADLRKRDGEYAMRICAVNVITAADGRAANKYKNVERFGA